jgi:hypothetical protein
VYNLTDTVHALDDDDDLEEAQLLRRHPYWRKIRALTYAEWLLEAAKNPYPHIPVDGASYL